MVMTHTHVRCRGQRSLGSKVRAERDRQTDGRTDGDDCISCRADAAGIDNDNYNENDIDAVFDFSGTHPVNFSPRRHIGLHSRPP